MGVANPVRGEPIEPPPQALRQAQGERMMPTVFSDYSYLTPGQLKQEVERPGEKPPYELPLTRGNGRFRGEEIHQGEE